MSDKSPVKMEEPQQQQHTKESSGFYVDDVIVLVVIWLMWLRFVFSLQSYGMRVSHLDRDNV